MSEGRLITMEVKGLMLDPTSNNPIVILRAPDSTDFLPIWIGLFEASAIQLGLEEKPSARPRTHDLLASFLEALEAKVERIVVEDLRDQTYYALIHLQRGDDSLLIDARPSDAIALAVRLKVPILVRESVLEKARVQVADSPEEEQERIRKVLEDLDPEDLGEYEM